MGERIVRRYSAAFKQQVVADLESGRFSSIQAAGKHYGIGGASTIPSWLRRYGKNHLCGKVVRVERPDEANQMRQLRQQVKDLERALGQTQAENVLNASYLNLACAELGMEVEAFKKKSDGGPSTTGSRPRR